MPIVTFEKYWMLGFNEHVLKTTLFDCSFPNDVILKQWDLGEKKPLKKAICNDARAYDMWSVLD